MKTSRDAVSAQKMCTINSVEEEHTEKHEIENWSNVSANETIIKKENRDLHCKSKKGK